MTNGDSHEISVYGGTSYDYVGDSYLAKATSGSNTYTLYYDALGRCVKRSSLINGVSTTNYYIFDGEHWVMEYNSSGTNISNAVYGRGMDEVIARGVNGQGWFYFPDRNGNISVVTDGANTVRESYRYDAFGLPTVTVGAGQQAINNRFLFTGREWNQTFGFYEYRARAYNPTIGRFMSEDPKGFDADDYNLYRYCSNDPLNKIDPMGLYWFPLTEAQKKIFDQVRKYLSKDAGMKALFEAVDTDKVHGVQIVFTNEFKFSQKDQFKGIGNSKGPTRATFEWNPAAARANTNGTKNSPAMIFGHELDHVVRWFNDPKGYERDNKPDGPGAYHQFGTFEERRVIRGSETRGATTLRKYGEGVRNDGGGAPYRVESPTFDEP